MSQRAGCTSLFTIKEIRTMRKMIVLAFAIVVATTAFAQTTQFKSLKAACTSCCKGMCGDCCKGDCTGDCCGGGK
jgi:hypothetical protein